MTPLIDAAVQGNEGIVTLLTDWGADVNARSKSGATALLNAALNGHIKIVVHLEGLGADIHSVDQNGWDALLAAALIGKAEVCTWLIAKSADARVVDKNNFSALTHFGLRSRRYGDSLAEEEKQLGQELICAAWGKGPHSSQVIRRNWERRWPLTNLLVGAGFLPLAHHRTLLASAALPTNVPIPRIPIATAEQRHSLFLSKIFGNAHIVACIVKFI